MAKESVLTSGEKSSIIIRHFIFHIISTNSEEPTTLAEVKLSQEQRQFFCEQLAKAAQGSQFLFTDSDASTPQRCKRVMENPEANFYAESVGLAKDFLSHHRKNMSDGVFIVALITVQRGDETIPLISLLKVDHAKVLQYRTEQTEIGLIAKLQELLNTFVEDNKALQKVALIDCGRYYAWDVLVQDRKADNKNNITEYFRKFLSAKQREDDSYWTRIAISAINSWALSNSENLDLTNEASGYKHRAIVYMETHSEFDTDEFVTVVLNEADPKLHEKFKNSLNDWLSEKGISGQKFSPKPKSIPRNTKLNKRVTMEGVTVEWEGDSSAAGITFVPIKDNQQRVIRQRVIIDTDGFSKRD